MATIGTYAVGRDNNFNLLHMLAATGVLVSHAYPISLGPDATQPLERILGGQTLGLVSVYVFFAISGFFITKSFVQTTSWRRFLLARVLRLFPALIVVLIVTIVISGTFLTTCAPAEFWSAAPQYFARNITLFRLDYELPCVFGTNPYGPAINGSLWTLFYEVVCYTGVFVAGMIGALSRPRLFAAFLLLAIAYSLIIPWLDVHVKLGNLATLGLPFAIGSAFYIWRNSIPLSPVIGLVMAGLGVAAIGTVAFQPILAVTLAYATFLAGFWPSGLMRKYNRLGDYSYGTYIYAFPVQQLVASTGVTAPMLNMALALPLTLICAVISWKLVERPALTLKSSAQSLPQTG